jgi:shikimate dehydrogenase
MKRNWGRESDFVINSETKIIGIIGYPLEHSLSPLLHNQASDELGLNYVYLPFSLKPDYLEDGINAIRAFNIRGVNVTIPYKEGVIPYLDELDPLAEEIGAVNTIVNTEGHLKGYNTDMAGFQHVLEKRSFKIEGKTAVIIGAGGASRAVGIALCQKGIKKIYLINRTEEKALRLLRDWQMKYPEIEFASVELKYDQYKSIIREADLLVDTTPVGMTPEIDVEPVISPEALHSKLLVIDLVYNPEETCLLKAADDSGAEAVNGLEMLIYQGIESFRLWTGYEPVFDSWQTLLKKII